jgi:hypothetical protein
VSEGGEEVPHRAWDQRGVLVGGEARCETWSVEEKRFHIVPCFVVRWDTPDGRCADAAPLFFGLDTCAPCIM